MSHKTLPYLTSLRTAVASLSTGIASDPGLTMQCMIAGRVLDYMVVQRTVELQLKAEYYAATLLLLPEAERLLAEPPAVRTNRASSDVDKMDRGNAMLDSLREIKNICTTADLAAFDRFRQLSSEVQGVLFALDTPAANAVCKAIVQIDAAYNCKFLAAVDAQAAASSKASQGASAIRNTRSYDERALLAFIRNVYPDETELEIEQSGYISGGNSKFTIVITLSNAKSLPTQIVLRGDAGATFCGAPVADEYRLIKTLYKHGVCVPKPLALEESGSVFGSKFMLMERNEGTSIGHMFDLPKQPNPALCEDIAVKLAALHRVPTAAFGESMSGADCPSSAKALDWIEEGFNNWRPLEMPSTVFATAFEWLRRHAYINDKMPRTLVHGDYGLNNLLVVGDKVTAILDWEFAHIGNPAYDLGYFYCMAPALSSWQDFLAAYGKAGMPVPDEAQLNYNILFATTRLGVMTAQVTRAFTSGAETGLAAAGVTSNNLYNISVMRIGAALDQVL